MEQIVSGAIQMAKERISPEFRTEVISETEKLGELADETGNPWDAVVVLVLKVTLGMK